MHFNKDLHLLFPASLLPQLCCHTDPALHCLSHGCWPIVTSWGWHRSPQPPSSRLSTPQPKKDNNALFSKWSWRDTSRLWRANWPTSEEPWSRWCWALQSWCSWSSWPQVNRTLEKKKCGLKLVPGPGFEFPCSVVAGVEFSLARSGEGVRFYCSRTTLPHVSLMGPGEERYGEAAPVPQPLLSACVGVEMALRPTSSVSYVGPVALLVPEKSCLTPLSVSPELTIPTHDLPLCSASNQETPWFVCSWVLLAWKVSYRTTKWERPEQYFRWTWGTMHSWYFSILCEHFFCDVLCLLGQEWLPVLMQ